GLGRRLHRQGAPRERAMAAPSRGQDVLCPDQLGRAAKNPRRRGRLPPLIAARGRGAQAAPRAQPVLQRARELDRIPSNPGRLRTGRAHPRPHDVEPIFADGALDRRPDLVPGRALAARRPARPSAPGRGFIFGVQILLETFVFGESVPGYPSVIVGLMVLGGVQLIMIGIMGEYIGKILSELKARPVYFVAEHTLKTAETADAVGGPPARSAAE